MDPEPEPESAASMSSILEEGSLPSTREPSGDSAVAKQDLLPPRPAALPSLALETGDAPPSMPDAKGRRQFPLLPQFLKLASAAAIRRGRYGSSCSVNAGSASAEVTGRRTPRTPASSSFSLSRKNSTGAISFKSAHSEGVEEPFLETDDLVWSCQSAHHTLFAGDVSPDMRPSLTQRRIARRLRGFCFLCLGAIFVLAMLTEAVHPLPLEIEAGSGNCTDPRNQPTVSQRWWRRFRRRFKSRYTQDTSQSAGAAPVVAAPERPERAAPVERLMPRLQRLLALAVSLVALGMSAQPPVGQLAAGIPLGAILVARLGAAWAGCLGLCAGAAVGVLLGCFLAFVICFVIAPVVAVTLGKYGESYAWVGFMLVAASPAICLSISLFRLCQ
eukprot:TRINITY_DN90775_c0_g1_i1.p1 TRINITY_DN90775_c0_g1~~TRINITY_DN90775_c0_g1_i1.p1  ORF type:complete len:387 (+),score=38.39 TRINITY_DN90775_c0_g1_i1:82-1242(+)